MNDILVKIDNVSFSYSHESVLSDINLEIKKGDFLGVIGPNGSGKTTLLKIIVGLLKPSSGSVTIFGKEPSDFRDRSLLGYVPQRAGLTIFNFPITVSETVSLGLISSKEKSANKIEEALKAVNMYKYKDHLLRELSGGQQQRVFIARALVASPQLLILDEPTVGIDAEAQNSFYELLKNLNRNSGLTLVLVSHDIDVVSKEVTQIVCLNGKLLGYVTPEEFKKEHYLEKLYGENHKRVVHKH